MVDLKKQNLFAFLDSADRQQDQNEPDGNAPQIYTRSTKNGNRQNLEISIAFTDRGVPYKESVTIYGEGFFETHSTVGRTKLDKTAAGKRALSAASAQFKELVRAENTSENIRQLSRVALMQMGRRPY